MNYHTPSGYYLAGVNSIAIHERYRKNIFSKRRTKCDRVWKFKYCRISTC